MLPLFIGRPLRPFRALRTAKLRPIGRGFVRIHIARQRPVCQRLEAAKKLLLFFSQPRLCPSARTPFSLMAFLGKTPFFRSRASSDLCRFASRAWPFHHTIQSFEKLGYKKGLRRYYSTQSLGIRQRPILPGRFQPSTFSAERLNFCVRYGYRWFPLAIATGNFILFSLFIVP